MLQDCTPAHHDPVVINIPVPLFALDGSGEHLPAHIQAVDAGTIQLRTRSPLSCGRLLVTRYEGCRIELEVVACQEEAGNYLIDCKVRSSQKGTIRDDWRMVVNWAAQVEVPGSPDRHEAQVRDISLFGLGIELAWKPELNSLVLVHMENGTSLGRVKHYRKLACDLYLVGLYLEEFCPEEERSSQNLSCLLRPTVHTVVGT